MNRATGSIIAGISVLVVGVMPLATKELVQSVNDLQKDIADLAIALGKLALTVLVLVSIVYLIVRLFRPKWVLSLGLRRKQTVISEFENAIDKESDYLTKLVRACIAEKLREHLSDVGALGFLLEAGNKRYAPVSKIEETKRDAINTFLNELAATIEKPELKLLALIVRWLLPVPGIKVGGHLLKIDSAPQSHGLVVELCDLVSEETRSTHSFWGLAASPEAQRLASSPSPSAVPAPGSQDVDSVYLNLGRHFVSLDQFEKAISHLEEGLTHAPQSKELAGSLTDAVTKQTKKNQARSSYDVAAKFQDLGLLPQAKEYYMRALSFQIGDKGEQMVSLVLNDRHPSPERAEAYYFLGSACKEHHLRMEAESFYRSAVENDPDNGRYRENLEKQLRNTAEAYKQIGALFEGLGKYDDAEFHLTNALDKSPDDKEIAAALARVKGKKQPEEGSKEAEYKLGLIYEGKGLYGTAKTHFEEAIKKDPTYKDAVTALERVLGKEDKTSAQTYSDLTGDAALWIGCHIMAEMLPKSKLWPELTRRDKAQRLNYLGDMFIGLNAYEDAVVELHKAVKSDKKWYLPHLNLGNAYSYLGRQSESVKEYEAASKKADAQPQDTEDIETTKQTIDIARACSLWLMGEETEAARLVTKVEQAPQSSNVKYTLACYHSRVGNAHEAFRWLTEAMKDEKLKEELRDWAWRDPDLEGIRGKKEFRELFS